jgi:hypothetical protein
MHSPLTALLTMVSVDPPAMSRHRKTPPYDAAEKTKNNFAIIFGVVVVALMGALVILAGLMN